MKQKVKQSVLLLLCLDDLPHRTEKVRGSNMLELSWAKWYLSAFYLHTRSTTTKKALSSSLHAEITIKTHFSHFCFLGSLFFPAIKKAAYYFLNKVSIKIDNGKPEDIHKAFLSDLFCKAVCFEERWGERMFLLLSVYLVITEECKRKQNANVPPQISDAGSQGTGDTFSCRDGVLSACLPGAVLKSDPTDSELTLCWSYPRWRADTVYASVLFWGVWDVFLQKPPLTPSGMHIN